MEGFSGTARRPSGQADAFALEGSRDRWAGHHTVRVAGPEGVLLHVMAEPVAPAVDNEDVAVGDGIVAWHSPIPTICNQAFHECTLFQVLCPAARFERGKQRFVRQEA